MLPVVDKAAKQKPIIRANVNTVTLGKTSLKKNERKKERKEGQKEELSHAVSTKGNTIRKLRALQ